MRRLATVALVYIAAAALANLAIAHFGPVAAPAVAFLLIGFAFVARDAMHELLRGSPYRTAAMLALILTSAGVSYLVNPASFRIGLASALAYIVAETLDWAVYALLDRYPFLARSNGSNVVGSLADSIIFPAVAFGGIPGLAAVMGLQFIAKLAGGFVWSLVIHYTLRPDARRATLGRLA